VTVARGTTAPEASLTEPTTLARVRRSNKCQTSDTDNDRS
jgi:hypothetical protein